MMFVIRNDGREPEGLEVKLRRHTPRSVTGQAAASGGDLVDWFCLGDPATARSAGHNVVTLHDGWYTDDTGGGVVIFGPYWEIRDTPFTVREVAPDPAPVVRDGQSRERDLVDVRKAIFGA